MTDPGMADRTYIGPMTPEYAEQILAKVSTAVESASQKGLQAVYVCVASLRLQHVGSPLRMYASAGAP